MKKRITAIIFILLLIGSVAWMITEGRKPEVLPIGSMLPDIGFLTHNGRKTITEIDSKIMIVFFSKECPYCKYELEILNENIEKLKDTRLYLLTEDRDYLESDEINSYSNLLNSENITFGIVNKDEFKTKFGSLALPSLFFFSESSKLTAKIKGETKIERILFELKIEN